MLSPTGLPERPAWVDSSMPPLTPEPRRTVLARESRLRTTRKERPCQVRLYAITSPSTGSGAQSPIESAGSRRRSASRERVSDRIELGSRLCASTEIAAALLVSGNQGSLRLKPALAD